MEHNPDPLDSPLTEGIDSNGHPVSLGEADSNGDLVLYIDVEGLCWGSRCEREVSLCVGRYLSARNEWTRTGGLLGAQPQPADFLDAVDPRFWPQARAAIADAIMLHRLLDGERPHERAARFN